MKLTYLAHSCFLLETSTHTLLFDPFLTGGMPGFLSITRLALRPERA